MSKQYDSYIDNHVKNVICAFDYIHSRESNELNDIFKDLDWSKCGRLVHRHDDSKWTCDEYDAYDRYFYPLHENRSDEERVEEINKQFDYAWLHHIHNNPHHWQYWILQEDDPEIPNVPKVLDIPDHYIVEMICDWWSFSWSRYFQLLCMDPRKADRELYKMFDWYQEHKNKMMLHPNTRVKVEKMLEWIRDRLDSEEILDRLD